MAENQIPAADVLAVETFADGTAAAVVRDRAARCFEIVCSVHKYPLAYPYSRGITETEIERLGERIAADVAKHAADRHTSRATGSQS